MRKNYEGVSMKKVLIMLAAMAVMGVGTAIAEGYWSCVGDAMTTGAQGGVQAAEDLGIANDNIGGTSGRVLGAGAGAIGGAAAGLINCE